MLFIVLIFWFIGSITSFILLYNLQKKASKPMSFKRILLISCFSWFGVGFALILFYITKNLNTEE